MKIITLMLSVLFIAGFVHIGKAQALTRVTVEFDLPHGDDRDHDTRTDVTIRNDAFVIAQHGDVAHDQHLADPGHYGPYEIPIVHPVSKSEYQNSKTVISDFPNGHDTWKTFVWVRAHFSDGSELLTKSGFLVLVNRDSKEFHN
jgi:hypothetical protein